MSQTKMQTYDEIAQALSRILSQMPNQEAPASEPQARLRAWVRPALASRARRQSQWPPATLGDPRRMQAACWHRNSCLTCPGRLSCHTCGR